MNESVIIISSIVIIVLGGVYFLYKLGEYLYELWTEYNTVDPTQESSDTPKKSFWESIEPHLDTIANLAVVVIGGILKVSENYRKQSYKVEKPDIPRPTYKPDIIRGRRIVNNPDKTPTWKSSEELNRMRELLLNESRNEVNSYFRGRGSKYWTTEEVPKKPKKSDTWDTGLFKRTGSGGNTGPK